MQTDDLIAHLTGGLEPVRRTEVMRILTTGLLAGMLGSALLMEVTIGIRHDIVDAMGGGAFWLKFVYTFVIAALGLKLVERVGRPGTDATVPALLIAIPVLVLMAMMAMQMMPAGDASRRRRY